MLLDCFEQPDFIRQLSARLEDFTSLAHPITVAPAALGLDFWVMLGISLLVLGMLATQRRVVRTEGILLLAIYLGYCVFLFWK